MNGGTRQGIDLTRVLNAPQRRVFAAWTSPEDFAAWYGGEAEVPLDRVSMDVRPGGAWSLVIVMPGVEMPFHGVYREVSEPDGLVLTLKDGSAPGDPRTRRARPSPSPSPTWATDHRAGLPAARRQPHTGAVRGGRGRLGGLLRRAGRPPRHPPLSPRPPRHPPRAPRAAYFASGSAASSATTQVSGANTTSSAAARSAVAARRTEAGAPSRSSDRRCGRGPASPPGRRSAASPPCTRGPPPRRAR